MLAGMTAWKTTKINIENDQGFQRTATLKDCPAFETYEKEGDSRKTMVVVADRYLVSIEANHVTEDKFKKLVDDFAWDKLKELK